MGVAVVWIGTNPGVRERLLAKEYPPYLWASNDLETVAHYYEGCVLQLEVKIDSDYACDYARDATEAAERKRNGYYGFGSALMECPAGAVWWSFSVEYLSDHILDVHEVFPDLSEFFEEEEDEE